MIEIHRPRLSFEYVNDDIRRGQLVLEPLEKGYGVTIATAMKDALMLQMPGAAPVAARIEGAQHPDQRMGGLKEDIPGGQQISSLRSICLRLKNIHVSIKEGAADQVEVTREFKGPVTVKAGDLAGGDLVVYDAGIPLFHVDENASVKLTVLFARGVGYSVVSDLEDSVNNVPEGTSFINAMFSPVKRVDYHVGDARIGQEINYDRLIMDVTTDGTVDARSAIIWAAKFLNAQLDVLDVPFGDRVIGVDMIAGQEESSGTSANISINDVEMTIRVRNCLKIIAIETLQDLASKTPEELLQIKNFGRKSLNELRRVLQNYGLGLSGDRPDQGIEDDADFEDEDEIEEE